MDSQLNNRLSTCSILTKATALTFPPERFHVPFTENIHDKIFDLIDGKANKVAITAPKEISKAQHPNNNSRGGTTKRVK